jgi:hypothetical protein
MDCSRSSSSAVRHWQCWPTRRSVLGAAANRSAFRVVATVSVAAIAVLAVAALVVDLA